MCVYYLLWSELQKESQDLMSYISQLAVKSTIQNPSGLQQQTFILTHMSAFLE